MRLASSSVGLREGIFELVEALDDGPHRERTDLAALFVEFSAQQLRWEWWKPAHSPRIALGSLRRGLWKATPVPSATSGTYPGLT